MKILIEELPALRLRSVTAQIKIRWLSENLEIVEAKIPDKVKGLDHYMERT